MEKVGKQELYLCPKGNKYDGLRKALERYVFVDEDYAKLLGLLFLQEGDNPNCTRDNVEDDPLYMNFLANTKLDGTSYVSKVNDQNGLPVSIKYEKDRELEIHGVEKGQDIVREKYEMGRSLKTLKSNARENMELESHGVEKGHDKVGEKYKLGWSSKAIKTNAGKNRMEDGVLRMKRGNEDRVLDNRKKRIDAEIVPGKEQKMKDGILSKKRGNEDKYLDNRKKRIDVEIVPGKEQKMKDGILSKKRGNEDRDLDKRKQRIDVEIVPGKEQKMKDGILSKKRGNEDRDLDKRKQRNDVEIVPGKEQKMKDKILSKKRRNEDRDLDNRKPKHQIDVNIVPGKEQQMKDDILSKRRENEDRDLDNRIDVRIVHGRMQKMNDGILSKKRGNENRGLDNWKHISDVNMISGKEQKIQNDSKFMDAEVKLEPKEDSDSLKEARSQSEVEILENVGAEVGGGSSSNPFVPSVEHCLNLDATIIDSRYRKEVLNLLMRPYNEEEYKKLWKNIKMQLPSSSTNGRGKSFLSQHKAVNRAIKRTNHDKDKKLNIMRGFFFWLEHLARQDAFQPWEDAECLQTMPGSS